MIIVETLPKVLENRKNVKLVSLEEAVREADVVVVLVKHKEFSAETLGNDVESLDFVNVV